MYGGGYSYRTVGRSHRDRAQYQAQNGAKRSGKYLSRSKSMELQPMQDELLVIKSAPRIAEKGTRERVPVIPYYLIVLATKFEIGVRVSFYIQASLTSTC